MADSLENLSTDQLIESARLFRSLLTSPDTRESVQRAIKKVNPLAVIPEIDAHDSVMKEVAIEREARLKLEGQLRERDARESIEKQRSLVKSTHKLSDADVAEVEKKMTELGIPNYDAAARVVLAERKTADPTPAAIRPPTYEMPESDVWKGGIGNRAQLDKIAINEAYKAFNEITGRKAA